MLLLAALCFFSLFRGYQSMCWGFPEKSNLRVDELEGQWWEYQSFNGLNLAKSEDYECMVQNFYPEYGNTITVIEDFVIRVPGAVNHDHTRKEWSASRSVRVRNPSATFKGEFDTGFQEKRMRFQYAVIETDYNNWLMAAVCSLPNDPPFGGVYVYTRKQKLAKGDEKQMERNVQAVIETYGGMKRNNLYTTKDNTHCDPVVFPDYIPPHIH